MCRISQYHKGLFISLFTWSKRFRFEEQDSAGKRPERQGDAIEKANFRFKERRVESAAPREQLGQNTFQAGTLKGAVNVYLQAVVDTYGS